MTYTTLTSASELQSLYASDSSLVVLDASFDLADTAAGERSHADAHLPGARYAHLERDLSGPKTGLNGRHPLPQRQAFAATAGHWGITRDTQVVVYDNQAGMFAARVWWMLRWLGHDTVAVLDGGLSVWREAGGPLTREAAGPVGTVPYPDRPALVGMVDADALQAQLGRVPVLDARAPERFRGDVEPLDAVAGHIPGARNRFFKNNLDASGRFKPAAELRAEYLAVVGQADAGDVVHQCGSGATACHNLLAMEVAGLPGSRLYPGSWSEWSSQPGRPVAKG
jgi:thiosulfate/3-mercaptopyruvate sulfurtransferase